MAAPVLLEAATSTPSELDAEALAYTRAHLDDQLRDRELVSTLERTAEATLRVRRGALVARELVWGVVGDIYAGTLSWEPDRVPLRWYVTVHMKRRASVDRRAAAMHVALLDVSDEMVHTDPPNQAEPALGVDPAEVPALLDEVGRRAVGDAEVLQLVERYQEGITRKADIRARGMSDAAYRNARRRLKRFALAAAESMSSPAAHGANGEASVAVPRPRERRSRHRAIAPATANAADVAAR